jgi:SAM-dependent methyltransferase
MRRLTWNEIRQYWETHAEGLGALDLAADPDALGNVVWPGQPLWLNEHLAALQEPAYRHLLELAPAPEGHGRALDVGCGSGRWCRLLRERGYDVVGIDLQEALIEADRERYPDMRFEVAPLQDFDDPDGFDLISSVTVIQHNPIAEQAAMARRIRELTRDRGHLVLLENVHEQSAYVFSRTVEGWSKLFADVGFRLVATRAYDFSPFLRAVLGARNRAKRLGRRGRAEGNGAPSELSAAAAAHGLPGRSRGRRPLEIAMRGAVRLDRPLERLLASRGAARGSIHCGFLFEAV